ncbi:MAG TPA: tetratricopeptide repeat protein [Thermoplasmata archaeon]|nr:tetratricopeptide repeat protein [Thermoplasmata archaeon]
MKLSVQCPSCDSTNDLGQARCRVCGADLRAAMEAAGTRSTVQLQRVLGGEVYRAVTPGGRRPPEATQEIPHEAAPPNGEHPEPPAADPLATLTERIAARATAAGQRFKQYAADRPRHAETDDAKSAVTHQLDSAARAFRERRFDVAIEHLLKAIAKEDGDPRSWILLGEAYLRLERPYKAAVGYLRALQLDVSNDNAWLGLARSMKTMEDLPGALEVLDRTVQSNPALTEAWSERGLVLESLDRPAEAAKSFQKALELRPDHRTARVRYEKLAPKAVEPPAEPTPEPTETVAPKPEAPPATEAEAEEEEFPDFADLAELPETETKESGPSHPARIRTFIEGLDETMGGGIPWGHVILVEGSPGTMKSSLAFSILAQNAAQDGLHCLYLSFEERTSGLLKQMGSLNLPLHVHRGSLIVMDPRAAKGLLAERKDWVDAFQVGLEAVKGQRGLDLVVIDSLEALEVLAKFKDRRREIFRLFEWLRDLDVTSFVITERPDWVVGGHVIQGRWDEDFLADGVIHVRQHLISDVEVQRRLRVVKMRGTKHDTGYMALVLDEGRFKVTRAMSP